MAAPHPILQYPGVKALWTKHPEAEVSVEPLGPVVLQLLVAGRSGRRAWDCTATLAPRGRPRLTGEQATYAHVSAYGWRLNLPAFPAVRFFSSTPVRGYDSLEDAVTAVLPDLDACATAGAGFLVGQDARPGVPQLEEW